MDIDFDIEYCDTLPKFNQDILDGITHKQLKNPKDWVDTYIRTAERSFPEEVEYIGSKICSPFEAYRVMAGMPPRGENVRVIDLATNDVFMVRYQFRANGVDLHPKHMFLPNIRKGNRIRIGGKEFGAMAVMVDPGFSVTSEYVFIRVARAPVTFNRRVYSVMKDGETLNHYIAHSKLHWKGGAYDKGRDSDQIKVGQVVTSLTHYLLCKYGVHEAFRRYANAEVKIMHRDDVTDDLRKTHAVYTTRGVAPKALKLKIDYNDIASRLAILLPRDKINSLTEDMVTAMWYVIDHFPDMDDPSEIFTDYQWKVWLGYILFGDNLGHPKLVENIESHLKSLDDYIDVQTQREIFEEENLMIDDFYHLLAYVIENMNNMILTKEHAVASMYSKRLVSGQYILKDIVEKIFKCMFELNNSRRRKSTETEYNTILARYFTASTIMGLRNTSEKPFMAIVTSPGDNMYYRGTSRLVMQARTGEGNVGSSSKVNVDDPANHLHQSWMECGNYGILPHAYPLAKSTLNPTVQLDEYYTMTPKEHLKDVIKYVESRVHR